MRLLFTVLFFTAALVVMLGSAGCANIVPPQGGPRDSLPPRLVRSSPPDSTINFRANRITLEFDEFVDLKDLTRNVLFTPTFENNPRIEVRLRTMNIIFKDSLASNATYTLNFGNALVDVNEGNPLRNFTYTFSTGPVLDSLTLSGNVLNAEDGTTDSTLMVLLYRNLADSAVQKERAPYIARLNAAGAFRFVNLPAGQYKIYALAETGGRNYLSKAQSFAFLDSAVIVAAAGTTPVRLFAYKERTAPPVAGTPALPTTVPLPGASKGAERRLRLGFVSAPLDVGKRITLTADAPLTRVDSTGIQFTDTSFRRLPFTSTLDSTRRILGFNTVLVPGGRYKLILNQNFAEDSLGRKLLKTDTLDFSVKNLNEYGTASLRFTGLDTLVHAVLQLVQNNNVVRSVPVINNRAALDLLQPADYSLRILYDRNKNGVWDSGSFPDPKRQPERVLPLSKTLSVKAGFANDMEVAVPPL